MYLLYLYDIIPNMETNLNHRKAAVELRLIKEDGSPAANHEIKISQKTHQFLFGCGGFDAVELAGGLPDGKAITDERKAFLEDKLEKIFSLHNFATLPFYLGRYEPVEGKPDENRLKAAARLLNGRKIKTKGHPLCWHTVCAEWLMNYSNSEILKK